MLKLTAVNIPFPYATAIQLAADGIVLGVQVTPSGDVAALVVACATATNVPFPYAIEFQVADVDAVRAVQV